MIDRTLEFLCTQTASTKRSDGGEPATNLASITIVPLLPLEWELAQTLALNSPRTAYQTFTEAGQDIEMGDVLVVDGVEYPIRAVADWPTDDEYLHLVVEAVK